MDVAFASTRPPTPMSSKAQEEQGCGPWILRGDLRTTWFRLCFRCEIAIAACMYSRLRAGLRELFQV